MKKKNTAIAYFFVSVGFMLILLVFGIAADEKIMPIIGELSAIKANEIANECIDNAVMKSFSENNINYDDFFINDEINGAFVADTVTINNFTLNLNRNIRNEVKKINEKTISVAMGAFFGNGTFSAYGPKINLKVIPYGEIKTDYETDIISSGINQTAVKIWVNTEISVKAVHPLFEEKICLRRKVMLVDTIIKGEVPNVTFPSMNYY